MPSAQNTDIAWCSPELARHGVRSGSTRESTVAHFRRDDARLPIELGAGSFLEPPKHTTSTDRVADSGFGR